MVKEKYRSNAYNQKYDNEILKMYKSKKFIDPNGNEPDFFQKPIERVLSGGMCDKKVGGSMVMRTPYKSEFYERTPKTKNMYVIPGTNNGTPRFSSSELKYVDRMKSTTVAPDRVVQKFVDMRSEGLEGGGGVGSVSGGSVSGGSFKSFIRGVGRVAKKFVRNPVVKAAISAGLDAGTPILGSTLGTAIGNPMLGQQITSQGRKLIKEKTGYGVKSAGSVKSGGQSGSRSGGQSVSVGKIKKQNTSVKKNTRGQIVSKVMKERGVSLAEASRIVKNENLY